MNYVYVAATAEVGREDRSMVSGHLEAAFGLPVRETVIGPVDFAFDEARRQYNSAAILQWLLEGCPADGRKTLAVTDRDLFVPALTFVFGHAQLNGRVAVCSLARLRQEFYALPADGAVLASRAATEALHETGHMFGLVHCAERTCAMSLATNVRHIDRKQAAFCPSCAARLQRLSRGTRE